MTLKHQNYTIWNTFTLAFQVAPGWAALLLAQRVVGALLPAGIVLATAGFIDTAMAIVGGGQAAAELVAPLLLLSGLVLYQWLLQDINKYFDSKLLIATRNTYKLELLRKRSRLASRHMEDSDTYDLVNRVLNNSDMRITDMFKQTMGLAHIIIQALSLVAIIFTHTWWAALAILAFSIPLFSIAWRSGKRNYQAFREAQKAKRQAEYYLNVGSSREAVAERALFGFTPKITEDMGNRYKEATEKILKANRSSYIRIAGGGVATTLVTVFVMGILTQPLSAGYLSAGLFMALVNACASLSYALSWPLTQSLGYLRMNKEYLKDLTEFLGLEEQAGALQARAKTAPKFEKIQFENVTFTYPGTGKKILDGASFTMVAGRQYAFVGENGAGKTTIIKLLTGQYTDYAGNIYLNGKELRTYAPDQLKAFFAVAYQDFAKYPLTVKENIAIGNLDGGDLEKALTEMELNDLVQNLPKQLDTPLGKAVAGGVDVSGGQWQRLALARLLMSGAPIKILDEPTSALDPLSESRLYHQFERIMKGSTSIFISHRLGSIKLADEIFVFKSGKVMEHGDHSKLVAKDGIYQNMYQSQLQWYQEEGGAA